MKLAAKVPHSRTCPQQALNKSVFSPPKGESLLQLVSRAPGELPWRIEAYSLGPFPPGEGDRNRASTGVRAPRNANVVRRRPQGQPAAGFIPEEPTQKGAG